MSLSSLIPPGPGLLPKWILFVSSLAIFNSAQNYLTTTLTARVYNNAVKQVNPLQARTFGIWTFTSAIVRFYAAYNIHDKAVYDITLWTYIIVLFHFVSELFVYRTAKLSAGVLSPLIVGGLSLVWMVSQRDYYLGL